MCNQNRTLSCWLICIWARAGKCERVRRLHYKWPRLDVYTPRAHSILPQTQFGAGNRQCDSICVRVLVYFRYKCDIPKSKHRAVTSLVHWVVKGGHLSQHLCLCLMIHSCPLTRWLWEQRIQRQEWTSTRHPREMLMRPYSYLLINIRSPKPPIIKASSSICVLPFSEWFFRERFFWVGSSDTTQEEKKEKMKCRRERPSR